MVEEILDSVLVKLTVKGMGPSSSLQDGHHPVRRDRPLHRRPLRLVRLEVPQEEEAKRGKGASI